MKRLNKLAAVFCVAAMALTAMTGCEGSDMFSVNSPDWLSEKIDSIEKANQSTEEVLVGMNEDVYTVGNTDFSSGFWTSFSKYYVVQDNQKWNAVFNLNINPSATIRTSPSSSPMMWIVAEQVIPSMVLSVLITNQAVTLSGVTISTEAA